MTSHRPSSEESMIDSAFTNQSRNNRCKYTDLHAIYGSVQVGNKNILDQKVLDL